eukprot:Phypoly_transcript_06141.p1 GENE.Phypoly_transcript_06141~~Phypoly_transcript_06141.p1  ORF type:complete len:472 (+),score=82.71 Phypoly_transcript_06141:35-1450(+)
MSVLLQTSVGEIVLDLLTKECPIASKNFLKLCKIKYYNNCLFYDVQKDFIVQTGDPTGMGRGGESIYGILYGEDAKYFEDEIHLPIKHKEKGVVAMANEGKNMNGSRFYITTRENLDYLDGKHTIFGKVVEGLDVLDKINNAFVDKGGRPLLNIRIKHTFVLDDPFPDPPSLVIPDASPDLVKSNDDIRPEADEEWDANKGKTEEEVEESLAKETAKSQATMLEILGDIPDADMKPPENVLFVCKLHPVTQEEDLELIFSRFGTILSCEVIKDWKTGDSLQYAFIEFSDKKECEAAYLKMDNVLIDDRRIHVDFSQSVSKMPGGKYGSAFAAFSRRGNKDNLQLKEHNKAQASGGTKGYDLVFDEADSKTPSNNRNTKSRDRGEKRIREEDDHSRKHDKHEKRDDKHDDKRDRRDARRDDSRDMRDYKRDDRGDDRRDDRRDDRKDARREDRRDRRDGRRDERGRDTRGER